MYAGDSRFACGGTGEVDSGTIMFCAALSVNDLRGNNDIVMAVGTWGHAPQLFPKFVI